LRLGPRRLRARKYKLIAHYEQHGIAHAPFTDFAHATALLGGILAVEAAA